MMPENFKDIATTDKPQRYDEIVYKLADIRKQQHIQLLELHNQFKKQHPRHPLNQAFKDTLKTIEIYEYDIIGFLNTKRGKKAAHHPEYSQKQRTQDGHVSYEFRPFLQRKLTYLSRSTRGYLTELVTSLHVPNVVGQGIHVEKLVSSHMISVLHEKGMTKEEIDKLKSFEIDVVFNNGHSWGEVKNYAFTFRENMPFKTSKKTRGQKSPTEKLLFKAELISKALKILNENNYNIKMHFYFYNNGVSRDFQDQLRDLNFIVEN